MLKANVSGDFYRIGLRPGDALKLGPIFPMDDGNEPLVNIPLNLSMV